MKSNLAKEVFNTKYSQGGKYTPDELCHKLAGRFADIEYGFSHTCGLDETKLDNLSHYGNKRFREVYSMTTASIANKFYEYFKDFKYIVPGGSVLFGVTSEKPVSFSNCFVLPPPEDCFESIFGTGRDMSQVFKRRGGCGTDLSNLRPKGSFVNNSANTSSGSLSFGQLYSYITSLVGQEGRRGALMLSIDVNHPDILDFIKIKRDLSNMTGANLSIRVNNEFMKAVDADEDYCLRFPCNLPSDKFGWKHVEYNTLIHFTGLDGTKAYFKRVKAREVWEELIASNWMCGEPGLLFWDNMLDYDPSSIYPDLKPVSTNPCAELALAEYDSCRLISVNLFNLVNKPFTEEAELDLEKAYELFYEQQCLADNLVELEIETCQRIMDVIDKSGHLSNNVEEYALWNQIQNKAKQGRRTGCGVFGYADMCAAMGVSYGEATLTEELFQTKLRAELDASIDMAIVRGAFPIWDGYIEWYIRENGIAKQGNNSWYEFVKEKFPEQANRMCIYGRRNVGLSTIPPTGTLSIICETTSGIEPLIRPFYKRRVKVLGDEPYDFTDVDGNKFKEYIEMHPTFIDWYVIASGCQEEPNIALNALEGASKEQLQEIYKQSPWYNNSSEELDWRVRVETQGLIQKYITSSISSTVNLTKDTQPEVIDSIYKRAYTENLKGITVYRNDSRAGVILKDEAVENHAVKRPKVLDADLYVGKGYIVVIGLMNKRPYEIFMYRDTSNLLTYQTKVSGQIQKIKKGHYKFISDLLTIERLHETEIDAKTVSIYISTMLRHNVPIQFINNMSLKISPSINSLQALAARILGKYVTNTTDEVCPQCGEKLVHEGGCKHCSSCDYSLCSSIMTKWKQ